MSELQLSWLLGETLRSVQVDSSNRWTFMLDSGGSLQVECPWRLLGKRGIVASSVDHGHKHGLASPIDSATEAMAQIGESRIERVVVVSETSDLHITFASLLELQIIPLSVGYEAWQASSPAGYQVIAQGGAQLTGFPP